MVGMHEFFYAQNGQGAVQADRVGSKLSQA